ncbi:MAG: radical SAM/SPASM domain-containing protein [Bacteroidales bacterium]
MNGYFARQRNAIAAAYSYLASSLTGKPVVTGMPVAISAELTNNCNLRCPECSTGSGLMTRPKGFMSFYIFEKLISELEPYLYNINLYFQGEPMLHPGLFHFLAKCIGMNTVISTNGHFLSDENAEKLAVSGLKKIVISLDGMDQQTYSSYRVNGDFDKVVSGIRKVSEAVRKHSSPMKIVIQFLVNRNNEHQIKKVRKFASEVNATLRIKSMQIINKEDFGRWLPSEDRFSRYENKCNTYTLKNSYPNRCARLWLSPVLTWDGKVLPCCFDKNADHIMGDLNEDSFREIWTGPEYRIFRKSVLSERRMNDICLNCTSGLKGVIR